MCATCGTSLGDVRSFTTRPQSTTPRTDDQYDFRYGETDLLESTVQNRANHYMVGLALCIILALVGFGILFVQRSGDDDGTASAIDTAGSAATRAPYVDTMPTVTQGPPTATASSTPLPTETPSMTPTREPCIQRIAAGDSISGAITRCGYRTLDVLPLVLEINNISDPGQIQANQEVSIPWPTENTRPCSTTRSHCHRRGSRRGKRRHTVSIG